MPSGTNHVLALSICLEAMADPGIDPHGGTCSWQRIVEQLPRYGQTSAKAMYANMVTALRQCLRPHAPSTDHEPF